MAKCERYKNVFRISLDKLESSCGPLLAHAPLMIPEVMLYQSKTCSQWNICWAKVQKMPMLSIVENVSLPLRKML